MLQEQTGMRAEADATHSLCKASAAACPYQRATILQLGASIKDDAFAGSAREFLLLLTVLISTGRPY